MARTSGMGFVHRMLAGVLAAALLPSVVHRDAVAGGALRAPRAPGDDVMQWLDDVDQRLVVDRGCMRSRQALAYRTDQLMVRSTAATAAVARVDAVLQRPDMSGPAPGGSWIAGSRVLVPPAPPSGEPPITQVIVITFKSRGDGLRHPIVKLARTLRSETASPPMEASPNYAYAPSPYVSHWPNGYPTPAPGLAPARPLTMADGRPVGTGVTIGVYDTGRAPGGDPRLANVSTFVPADGERPDLDADGFADYPAAGHGKAIAGVLATMVPGAVVKVARITDRRGVATDADAATRIVSSLKASSVADWPDLLVNAFGSLACDRTASQTVTNVTPLEPLAMEMVAEIVDRFAPHRDGGMLLVASAGNRKTNRPWYPAAFNLDPALAPVVLGVGALDASVRSDGDPSEWFSRSRTAPMAHFSNYGTWVDAWGPGVHLATTHLVKLAFDDDSGAPPVLQGEAFVDGTSFAAPVVAGLVAEEMSVKGVDAGPAWGAVRNAGAAPLPPCDGTNPVLGGGRAVIAVALNAPATKTGAGPLPTC